MVDIDLLNFVETVTHLAKHTVWKHTGESTTDGFTRWKHVIIDGLASKMDTASVERKIGSERLPTEQESRFGLFDAERIV